MNDMEIKSFLAAAKYNNFSEAANRLYISQSAFSRNIARLEKELQVTLFHRNTKNVELTPAGWFLNNQLEALYREFLLCVEKAQQLEKGLSGQLKLGLLEDQPMPPDFQKALKWISEEAPDVLVNLERDGYYELALALKEGRIDGIITLDWEVSHDKELSFLSVERLKTVLAIPVSHELANKASLTLADFKDDYFLTPSRMNTENIHVILQSMCSHYGFQPNIKYVTDMRSQLLLVEAGQGVAIVNENNLICHSPSVKAVSFPNLKETRFVFAWKTDNPNPALQRFLNYFEQA